MYATVIKRALDLKKNSFPNILKGKVPLSTSVFQG
jgi:hypothetical protein